LRPGPGILVARSRRAKRRCPSRRGIARANRKGWRFHRKRFRSRTFGRVLWRPNLHHFRAAIARMVCATASRLRMARWQSLSLQTLLRLLPISFALLHGQL
jgi:hypothetical protein